MANLITNKCPMCGKTRQLELTDKEFSAWFKYKAGAGLIQEMLPDCNPMEREFLHTGYCPACQKLLFGTNYSDKRFVKET